MNRTARPAISWGRWSTTERQRRDRPGGHQLGRVPVQIGLVVPLRLEQRGDGTADPQRFLGARRRVRQSVGDLGPGEAQLVVEAPQGDDGGRMPGDRAERAGLGVEHPADGEVDERRRHRRAPRGGERRAGDQFGEAVQRDHVDTDDADPPAECPARHDAARVGGHDDGDRSEAITGLWPRRSSGRARRGPRRGARLLVVRLTMSIVRMGCDTRRTRWVQAADPGGGSGGGLRMAAVPLRHGRADR